MKARSRSRPGKKARPTAHRKAAAKNDTHTCIFQALVSWRIEVVCMVSSSEVEVKKRAHLAGVAPASPSLPRAWLATAPRGARGATHGRLQPALWQSRRHRHSSPALDVLAPRRMLSFAPKGDLGLRAHDV